MGKGRRVMVRTRTETEAIGGRSLRMMLKPETGEDEETTTKVNSRPLTVTCSPSAFHL